MGGTTANINCCTASLGLDCNVYYAKQSDGVIKDSAYIENYFSCPAGQAMIACMGQSDDSKANAWYIGPEGIETDDVCVTRGWDKNDNVYTSATCCNERTLSPTPAPTSNPTSSPTQSTLSPTKYP